MLELCQDHRLIRYDERGNGLSDWEAEDLSLGAFVADLEAVTEAAGLERYALLGISQGCAIAIAHAVRHPERVTRLILYGGYACTAAMRRAGGCAGIPGRSRWRRRCSRSSPTAGVVPIRPSGSSSRRCSFPARRSNR
jgi:pimeloyl-ACP methyl ester carboxylesterase